MTRRLHTNRSDSRRGRHRTGRASTVTSAVLVGMVAFPAMAGAAVQAHATSVPAVGAGTWGAVASVTTMNFTTNTVQTSSVTNIGTIALSGESYSLSITRPTGRAPTFRVFQCAVPWVLTRCSGGAGTQVGGTLSANSTTIITSTTALGPGASLYLAVEPAGLRRATTVTITPQVTAPTQLRSPVRTNQ